MLKKQTGTSVWLYPAITVFLLRPKQLSPGHFSQCTSSEVEAREQDATHNASAATPKARAFHVSAMPRALLSIDKVLSAASALDIGAVDDRWIDFLAKV